MIKQTLESVRSPSSDGRRAHKPSVVALVWRKSSKDLIAVRSFGSLRLSLREFH